MVLKKKEFLENQVNIYFYKKKLKKKIGVISEITTLRLLFESNAHFDLKLFKDPFAVADILKVYLRELPEPLISNSIYEEMIKIVKEDSTNLKQNAIKMKDLLKQLPKNNYQVLKAVLKLFNQVAKNDHINKMNAKNLSIILSPALLVPPQVIKTGKMDMKNAMKDNDARTDIIKVLILEYESIFE